MVAPPLTIAIPAYKRAHAIGPLLRSLAEQSGPEDDLVVVDDASGDGIEAAVAAAGRFRLIRNETNLGMVGNWNACLGAARHDWICLIHHDDDAAPGAVEALRRACALAAGPALIVHQRSDAAVDRRFRCRWCEPGPWAVLNVPTIPSGAVVHRQILEDVGVFDPGWQYSADLEFFPRICQRFPLVVIESPDVVRYRLHETNHQYDTWQKPDFTAQLEEIQRLILRYAGMPEAQVAPLLQRRMAWMYLHMFIHAGRRGDRPLVRQIGRHLAASRVHGRKVRWQAKVAAWLGWYPGMRRRPAGSPTEGSVA